MVGFYGRKQSIWTIGTEFLMRKPLACSGSLGSGSSGRRGTGTRSLTVESFLDSIIL